MEFDENNELEEEEGDAVEIYSKWAIFGFSIMPSPLFGGILLMINLWAAGLKTAMYAVLAFVISYMAITDLLISKFLTVPKVINPNVIDKSFLTLAGVSLLVNLIGGVILSFVFFKKYFPENDYYPKSIAIPILVVIFLTILTRFVGF